MDDDTDDIVDGLENCVTRDGQNSPSANLPMNSFAHTGVAAATARTQYARVTEVQDGVIFKAASPGGTIDAMTGTLAPAITAYVTGMLVSIVAPGSASNTVTTPTLQLNGIASPKTIRKHQGALAVGDYTTGDTLLLMYDGTGFELLNPKYATSSSDLNSLTTDSTIGATGDFIPFVDVSDANASNKGTVQSLFTNVFANFTADTTGGATGDKLLFSDASESDAAQTVTADNFVKNALQLLATDNGNIGATDDCVPFTDTSASNAGLKGTWASAFYNLWNNFSADTSPDPAADYLLSRDVSGVAMKKVLMKDVRVTESMIIAVGDETSVITTGTAKVTFRMPYAFTLTAVRASLTTGSSSGTPTVDINEGGTTILSTKLTIDANEKTSTTAAVAAVISDASLADDAEITFDFDVSGTGATGMKVALIGYKT